MEHGWGVVVGLVRNRILKYKKIKRKTFGYLIYIRIFVAFCFFLKNNISSKNN
jgi:hypothetical protein